MNRYARMVAMPEIGKAGIDKIKAGRVAVIGCGALGSLVDMYLCGAGVGHLTIADFDTIDLTNLHRQLFFSEAQCGQSKAEVLAGRMSALNPECEVRISTKMVTPSTAVALLSDAEFVIDATDNSASKYMVDRICSEIGKPYCIGGVDGYSGQVMSWTPGAVRYSEIFEQNPTTDDPMLPCGIRGVAGPTAGVVASVQAAEAIKYLTGVGETLTDRLLTFDLSKPYFKIIETA